MPRFEVNSIERKYNPVLFLIYLIGFVYFGYVSFIFVSYPTGWSTFSFVLGLTVVIYLVGRLYGDLTVNRDFVEIDSSMVKFRSTPGFGEGWLPVNGSLYFNEINMADIVQISPFYNREQQHLAILLRALDGRHYLIGQNLSEDQIIKIGFALKGGVNLTKALRKLLGQVDDDLGDQVMDMVKKGAVELGKSVFRSFQNRGDE